MTKWFVPVSTRMVLVMLAALLLQLGLVYANEDAPVRQGKHCTVNKDVDPCLHGHTRVARYLMVDAYTLFALCA